MENDPVEDFKDSQEIKRQKEEQKRTNEKMAKWEFGKGVTKNKDDKRNVRD